jgi:1-acyl-sn-glycerol-3-phosphate acyltransferase
VYVPELGPSVPKRGGAITRLLGRFIMWCVGWRLEGTLPDIPRLVVLGAPHSSNYDFLLALGCMFSLGLNLNIMGKHTLFRWPLGGFMRWCGLISIDRRAAHGVVGETVQAMRSVERMWVGIAPEGTRTTDGDRWKSGFWHIARQGGFDVMPIAIDYSVRVIRFGAPFTPSPDVHADMALLSRFYGGIKGARRTIPASIDVR